MDLPPRVAAPRLRGPRWRGGARRARARPPEQRPLPPEGQDHGQGPGEDGAGVTLAKRDERGCRPTRNAGGPSCSVFLVIALVWLLKILGKKKKRLEKLHV